MIPPENPFLMQDDQREHFETPRVCRELSMDALADVLLDEVRAEAAQHDLFRKTRIIVPNRSIQRYLSLRFAHRYGIAAQLEFPSLMTVFRRFLPRTAGERPDIDGKTIGWRIYRTLLDSESESVFPMLTRWIRGDSKRLYDLSRQLGDLYDKYMLYRPWWINAWEAGRTPHGLNGEPDALWQGELWRRIAGEDWKGNHFAAVFDRLVRGGDVPGGVSGGTGPDGGDQPIRIFGFSQLPPTVLQCLEELHRRGATVKLYHLVPSGEYYADCKKNKDELREFLNRYFHEGQDPVRLLEDLNTMYFQHNPLLSSFAMQSCVMLNRTAEWTDQADFGDSETDAPDEGTILHRLQRRIRADLKATDVRPEKQEKGHGCRSVQIRNCYSAFREVEAAHNFILHCLNEDRDLPLKNIFIMTPTPADYAPLVDAVFNHSGDRRLGVSIADQPRTERLSSYGTLMKILALFKGDFAASEVFAILQDQSLQEHWGIAPDECQYCLTRAMRAGIRWGWDAKEHELSGGKAFPENSWQAGFDRMLLDYAVDADPMLPYQVGDEAEIFPVPGFDGGRAELLGKFAALVAKLHDIAQTMRRLEREGAPFRAWYDLLAESAGWLFGGDSELKTLLLSVLNVWRQTLVNAGAEDVPLTSGIVLAYLQDKHAKPEDNTVGFMRGKITFCGLRPMRSIPADAILLLGMNHASFPEDDDDREFDIMQQSRRTRDSGVGREPGDPVRRDESRQLFLDTILAARKYLYISYVGRDIHDRKEKPPSVCVDELRNYLTRDFGKNSFIELKEPIHAFSPELFRPGAVNQSFSRAMRDAAKRIADRSNTEATGERPRFDIRDGIHPGEGEQTDPPCPAIELETLKSFFTKPAEQFVRDGLDARLSVSETSSPEDSEPFETDLDFGEKDELFRSYLEAAGSDRNALEQVALRRLKVNGCVRLTQNEDDWQDWTEAAALAQEIEARTQNMTEHTIRAEEMEFECSAADAGALAGLIYDSVPTGTFRATLILPDAKVYRPENPEGPCVQMAGSFAKKIAGSQLVRPILDHIRANLVRKTETRIVFLGDRKRIVAKADAMEPSEAERVMRLFLCLYHAGLRKPLPFFPKTSYAYFAEPDERKKAAAAEDGWNGGGANSTGDVDRFGKYFGTELPISDCFKALAAAFFGAVVFRQETQPGKGRGKTK